jgi:triacylglycerol esterase/lipase EstA (alpha/beta hydrolase family)
MLWRKGEQTMTCHRRTLSELLAKILVLSAIAPTAWAQACQQQASDSSFVATGHGPMLEGFGAGSVRIGNSGSPDLSGDTVTYQITRVVGPGTDDEFDSNGFLANWDAYVQNGVLSREACITVGKPELIDGGVPPGVAVILAVYVNGHKSNVDTGIVNLLPECGNLFGCFGSVPLNTEEGGLKILTKYLKFPHRASPGSEPTAAINNIVIVMQPGTPLDHELGGWLIGNLTLKAMAPIVLVHGWNAGPWIWGPKPAVSSICPVNPDDTNDGGQNFVQAFIDAKVPFDCSISIKPQTSSILGAGQLNNQLTSILKTFGTRHVNLVAHSKGGLFARKFLHDNALSDPITEIGVVSLTTLDTPHHGSVLANTVVNFNNSLFGGFVNAALQVFQSVPGFLGQGANDLTIKGVRTFNDLFLQPPPQFRLLDSNGNSYITNPFYYSTSADADLDGSRSISSAEANPYSQLFGNLSYNIIARGRPVNVVRALGLLHANVSSLPNPIKNDLLVSIDGARYLKFTEINSFVGVNGRNHSTIRCGQAPECSSDLAPFVLLQIRDAETRQPAQ